MKLNGEIVMIVSDGSSNNDIGGHDSDRILEE